MSYLIGTDIGTLGTKSVLVDLEGRVLASAFVEYGVMTPRPGWAEQWPEVWFDAVCRTIREVLEKSKVNPREVAGVCISGLYGGAGVLLDEEMRVLRPVIIWADRRAVKEAKWIRENVGEDEVFKVSGNTIDPYYGYVKLLWVKRNEPNVWERVRLMLTPNAYCIYRLTGEVAIDHSSAGNFAGVYDIRKRRWSHEMMEALGFPPEIFPERLCMSKDVVGEVHEEGSKLTGLPKGTPVCAGGIDAPVSALSVGALRDGDLASMLGTSMCNGFIQDELRLSRRLVNYPYVAYDDRKVYSFAGITTAGYCVRWFRDQLGLYEKEVSRVLGVSAYQLLDLEASKVRPGSDGLIFLPHMMVGERAPWWDEYVRGTLIGLTVYHTRAHVFRAILEGVAYAVKYSIEVALKAGIPLRRIILVDGGARSPLWRQIIADVVGMEVQYLARAEGAPLGDALLAGVGTGVLERYEVIEEWLQVTETVKPIKENVKAYERQYRVFKMAYEKLGDLFRALSEAA